MGERFVHDDGGQVVVLFAAGLPLILVLLLIVIDGGRLYVEHERIRSTALLAAQAGASALADLPPGQAKQDRARAELTLDRTVKEAVERNFQETCLSGSGSGCRYAVERLRERGAPAIRVRVDRPFAATLQAIRFTLSAQGISEEGDGRGGGREGR